MKELTKKEIARSLLELSSEKKFSKITIEDIAEKAGITRQTFYYHFRDVIDLVEWICLDRQKEILQDNTFSNWQESFLKIFEECRKDKVFIMNILRNAPLDLLTSHLYNLVFPIIYKVVDEKSSAFIVKEEDKRFITDFYKYAFVALVLEWIRNNMEDDPEKIISKLSILLDGTIDHTLSNLGHRK